MYAYPIYPERNTQSLDGIWDFSFLGSDAPKLESVNPKGIACRELAAVPGCFDAAPKYAGRRGVGVYRRSVEAPAGVRLRLRLVKKALLAQQPGSLQIVRLPLRQQLRAAFWSKQTMR